jgi:hypothetical protein
MNYYYFTGRYLPPFDLMALSPTAWYTPEDVTGAGSGIFTMLDVSGNNNTLSMATAQQNVNGVFINGKMWVDGNGNTSMKASGFTGRTVVAVVDLDSVSGTELCFLGSNTALTTEVFVRPSAGGDISFDGTGTGKGKFAINSAGLSTNYTIGQSGIGTLSKCVVVGELETAQTITQLFGRSGFTSTNNPLYGDLVWFDRQLTSEELTNAVRYMGAKYGVTTA